MKKNKPFMQGGGPPPFPFLFPSSPPKLQTDPLGPWIHQQFHKHVPKIYSVKIGSTLYTINETSISSWSFNTQYEIYENLQQAQVQLNSCQAPTYE